jgi:hypothetical protein
MDHHSGLPPRGVSPDFCGQLVREAAEGLSDEGITRSEKTSRLGSCGGLAGAAIAKEKEALSYLEGALSPATVNVSTSESIPAETRQTYQKGRCHTE